MSHSRVFFPSAFQPAQALSLNEAAVKHVQVLRLQPGKSIELFNGEGLACLARIEHMGKHSVEALVTQLLPATALPACHSHVIVSMPANERMDWLIEKATELGVSRITPVMSDRSVVRLSGERALKRHAHWCGIAQAACSQSGRNHLPQIDLPVSLLEFVSKAEVSNTGLKVLLSFAHTSRHWRTLWLTPPASLVFLCGPEGGLTPAEEQFAIQQGFVAANLGDAVLRSETAALTVLAQLL